MTRNNREEMLENDLLEISKPDTVFYFEDQDGNKRQETYKETVERIAKEYFGDEEGAEAELEYYFFYRSPFTEAQIDEMAAAYEDYVSQNTRKGD